MVSPVLRMVVLRVLAVPRPLDAVVADVHTSQAAVSVSLSQDYAAYGDEYLVPELPCDAKYRIRPHILHYTQMYRRFGRRRPACCPIEWSSYLVC
ncbi:hypothetical protein BKA61DRAFT_625855 [Leptodontidium sp. MPI-SDFR-AT-0119]|nr:hypothetical protein BKA61DRAFT_625855 [Leptodontidium sp. MPI-SDFR-AT-0119]